jgi:hypothetical protein
MMIPAGSRFDYLKLKITEMAPQLRYGATLMNL